MVFGSESGKLMMRGLTGMDYRLIIPTSILMVLLVAIVFSWRMACGMGLIVIISKKSVMFVAEQVNVLTFMYPIFNGLHFHVATCGWRRNWPFLADAIWETSKSY